MIAWLKGIRMVVDQAQRRRTATRSRWKQFERSVAAYLGGERIPVTGRTRGWAPDVRHPWMAIEVKTRLHLPIFLDGAMDQARKAAAWFVKRGEGERLPVVIIQAKGSPIGKALIVMELGDFVERFGR